MRKLGTSLFITLLLSSCNISDCEITLIDDVSFETNYYDLKSISSFANNVSINFKIKVDINDNSEVKKISFEDIKLTYDEDKIEIKENKKDSKGNEFAYIVTFKCSEYVNVTFTINEFSKTHIFKVNDNLDISTYYKKRKINPTAYHITPLYTLDEYNSYLSNFNFESYLKPNELFYQSYFIVAVPFAYSSSSILDISYNTSFISDDTIYFNYTFKEGSNVVSDYNEDLYFFKVDKKYLDYNFDLLKTNILDED